MQVVRDVVVLMRVLQGFMLVMFLRPPHRLTSPDRSSDPTVHAGRGTGQTDRGCGRWKRRSSARPRTRTRRTSEPLPEAVADVLIADFALTPPGSAPAKPLAAECTTRTARRAQP